MKSDLTRAMRGATDPAALAARRQYERDRRFAVEAAERTGTLPFLVQYTTPDGIIATCDRDLAIVFARLTSGRNARAERMRRLGRRRTSG